MTLRTRRRFAVLLTMFLLVSACGLREEFGLDDDSDAAGQDLEVTEVTEVPVDDSADGVGPSGILRVANGFVTNSFNPHDDQTPATFSFYSWIYEGLVRQAADGSFTPWLAENWETSEDGLTVTFNLHDGVTFSDGAPFNAQAVKANIDFVKTAPADQVIPPVAGQMGNVDSVEVVHDLRVAFHLKQPNEIALISWLSRNSGLMVSPNSLGAAGSLPIGTGPYVYVPDESSADLLHVVYTANPTYWRPEDVGFERVEVDAIPDSAARKTAFEAGQYDVAGAAPELGEPSVGTQVLGPSVILSFTVVDWQGETIPALADKDVRCAMAQALNREGLVNQVSAPAESVRYQWAGGPNDYAWIDDLAAPTSFDIEAAKAAFEATGDGGFSFDNGYLPDTAFELGSTAWAGGLQQLGITMNNEELNPPSGGEMFDAFTSARYPIQIIPINEPHPLMTLQQRALPDGTLNPSKAVPDGVADLVTSASGKNNELAEADIEAAWKIMLEECIWIPYQTIYDGFWVQDGVTGLEKITGIPVAFWPQGVRIEG